VTVSAANQSPASNPPKARTKRPIQDGYPTLSDAWVATCRCGLTATDVETCRVVLVSAALPVIAAEAALANSSRAMRGSRW
jgi:hypothetical protein